MLAPELIEYLQQATKRNELAWEYVKFENGDPEMRAKLNLTDLSLQIHLVKHWTYCALLAYSNEDLIVNSLIPKKLYQSIHQHFLATEQARLQTEQEKVLDVLRRTTAAAL